MSNDQNVLLLDWFRRARESQFTHSESSIHFEMRNFYLGITTTILGIIVGSSVFISFDANSTGLIKAVLGICSILAGIIAGLNTFCGYAQRAEKHKSAAAGYSSIRRRLERIKTTPQDYLDSFDKELEMIQSELDNLASSTPSVPNKIAKAALAKIQSREHKRIFHILPR